MGVILRNSSVFLHIPKTGGNWITEIIEERKQLKRLIVEKHADCNRLAILHKNLMKKKPFIFCFVRHPVTWYESWYKYMIVREFKAWGYRPNHPCAPLDVCGDPDFDQFIQNIIKKVPGFVTELYSQYTKKANFIGKQETLCHDFMTVMTRLKIKYNRDKIVVKAPVNESKNMEIKWNKKLLEEIVRLEYAGIVRYGYQRIIRPCR